MRTPLIDTVTALRERMVAPQQVAPGSTESGMPPYMESFLAHLRLLVGVPFAYLVPDSRMLPTESIRFFYLDRSWTDRLVDGAIAVGKIGTREQAHHQAQDPGVRQQLDQTEQIVRKLQRGASFMDLRPTDSANMQPADVVTGFLLRSYLVTGWPQMEVRAYNQVIQEPFDHNAANVLAAKLPTLRLERLSPSIMIAMFSGIPQMVTLEEPHHGVQFGLKLNQQNQFTLMPRDAGGQEIENTIPIIVPMRSGNARVVDVASLWTSLTQLASPPLAPLSGGGSFALEALSPAFRQHFQGTVDEAGQQGTGTTGSIVFNPKFTIAGRVTQDATKTQFLNLVQGNGNPS
jgi:hypothetical protein